MSLAREDQPMLAQIADWYSKSDWLWIICICGACPILGCILSRTLCGNKRAWIPASFYYVLAPGSLWLAGDTPTGGIFFLVSLVAGPLVGAWCFAIKGG
jgi:hypothetical protein